jgi:NTE family protein
MAGFSLCLVEEETEMLTGTRVAVACQGGGSHAAFTAGVLKVLVQEEQRQDYQLTDFSGTSGGALSALLTWYGLVTGGNERVAKALKLLDSFWQEIAATLPFEQLWNWWSVWASTLPFEVRASPYAPPMSWTIEQLGVLSRLQEVVPLWGPRREFVDLKRLLEKYVRFDEVKDHAGEPWFLIGAVAITSGQFRAFDSKKAEISVEALLASAALPWLFRAVQIGAQAYWDGLFSQNPPIRDFITGRARGAARRDLDRPDQSAGS